MQTEIETSLKEYINECIVSFATSYELDCELVKKHAVDILSEELKDKLEKVSLYEKIVDIVKSGESSSKKVDTSKKKIYIDPTTLSGTHLKDYEKLKIWRSNLSKLLQIAPYMIFDNKTLSSIAHYKPKNNEELVTIKGVGDIKAEKYGDDILGILKDQ